MRRRGAAVLFAAIALLAAPVFVVPAAAGVERGVDPSMASARDGGGLTVGGAESPTRVAVAPWAGEVGDRSGQVSPYPAGPIRKLTPPDSAAVLSQAKALGLMNPLFGPLFLARKAGVEPGPLPPSLAEPRQADATASGNAVDLLRLLADPAGFLPTPAGGGSGPDCVSNPPINTGAPLISAPVPTYSGNTISTSDGIWTFCAPLLEFHYEWLRNGVVIAGATAPSYTVQGNNVDLGNSLQSAVQACDTDSFCSGYVASSNAVVPEGPDAPVLVAPVDGGITGATPTLSATFADGDGDAGYVAYAVYRYSDWALTASGYGPWVSSGSESPWQTPALTGETLYVWVAQAGDAHGDYSPLSDWRFFYVNSPPAVNLATPVAGASVPTTTPVLSANVTDAEGVAWYEFQVAPATDPLFHGLLADSGWESTTSTWTVPAGYLRDGTSYIWRVRAIDNDGAVSDWTTARSLTVNLPKLGLRDSWPIWRHGVVAVNEATGNLIVSVPGPSYPVANRSMDASLTYNSLDSSSASGLGAGWTLSVGDAGAAPPAKLVDHSQFSDGDPQKYDAVERISGDGSSDFYTRVGTSNTFLSGPGDGSQLTKNADNSWTLVDADGSVYTFGPTAQGPGGGVAPLISAEIVAAQQHSATLYECFSGSRVTSLRDSSDCQSTPNRELPFVWNSVNPSGCPDAILCVDGPDNLRWKYIGDGGGGITGRLVRVNLARSSDGALIRQLLLLGYDGSGRLNSVKNANDLDPTNASPNYNGSHSVGITYCDVGNVNYCHDGTNRVATVTDGPVTNQTPATSVWSFDYKPASTGARLSRFSHYRSVVLGDHPLDYWRLGETSGTTAANEINGGPNGSYSGGYSLGQRGVIQGDANTGLGLSGGHATFNLQQQLNPDVGQYTTVEFWMYWDGTDFVMPVSFDAYDVFFGFGSFGFNTACGDIYGTDAPTANAWHQVVAEFYNGLPGDGAKLFIDGTQQSLSQRLGSQCSRTISPNLNISGWTLDGNYRLSGRVDDVAIYSGALSADQVRSHYEAAWRDYKSLVLSDTPIGYWRLGETSGTAATNEIASGASGVYSGGAQLGQSGALAADPNSSSNLNGGTVAADVPNVSQAAGAYTTVEMWMYWDGTDQVMPVGFAAYDLFVGLGSIGFNTGCADIYGASAPSANAWHHVVAEFYNGAPNAGARLYVDGKQQSLSQVLGSSCSRTVSSDLHISGWGADGYHRMGGRLDEVAIYNGALTSDQVQAHYYAGRNSRSAAGIALLTPPRQQGTSKQLKVYYDNYGRAVESDDIFSNTVLTAYNEKSEPLWSEDQDGNPTDYRYGAVDPTQPLSAASGEGLISTTGPDPDGAGPLTPPVTQLRYDEKTIGTGSGPGTPLQGLQANYYENANLAGRAKVRTTDNTVDATWGTGGPSGLGLADNFSIRWSGDLLVSSPGPYTFSTVVDDGTRLVIDGILAIDDWNGQGTHTKASAPITLGAGFHKLVLEYKDVAGNAEVHLHWSSATIPDQVIPASALRPAWFNKTSTVSATGKIAFSHFADAAAGHPDYDLVRLADGTNLITSYTYDALGRLTQKVMPRGNTAAINSDGDLEGTPAPDVANFGTTYAYYDASGTGASATPPTACGGGSQIYQSQLLKSVARPGLALVSYVYDSAGRTIAKTNAAGTSCETYDTEGRLTSDKTPGEQDATTYTYDPAGNVRTATHPANHPTTSTDDTFGTTTTNYDEQNRLVYTKDSYNAEKTSTYDSESNLTTDTVAIAGYPSFVTNYVYDDADRLTSLTDPANRPFSFSYDARGELKGTQYPNGTFSWNDYWTTGWLTHVYNRHGTAPAPSGAPPDDQNALSDFSYQYDADGRRTQETRTGVNFGSGETTNYNYDAAGRLGSVSGYLNRTYCYDRDSNRTSLYNSAATCGQGTADITYTYPTGQGIDELATATTSANQLTAYNYTPNGDGQVIGRAADSFTWDGRQRLSGASIPGSSTQFTVDGTPSGSPVAGSSPSRQLDTTTLTSGWQTLGATTTDRNGKQAAAPNRVINVQNGGSSPIQFVKELGPATSTTSSATLTIPLTGNSVAAGETLIVLAGKVSTTANTVTDSKGNTYARDRSSVANGATNIAIFSARIATALTSSDSITVTFASATANAAVAYALEFAGVAAPPNKTDQVAAGKTGNGTALVTNQTPSSTDRPVELVVAGFGASVNNTFTAGTNYTRAPTSGSATAGGKTLALHGEWRVVATQGTQSATATLSANAAWVSGLVTYHADVTAPSQPTGLTATVTPGTAALTWSPSTDDFGVAYYHIYRSTTSGFTPGVANEIGQTTLTRYTDNGDGSTNGLPGGTYYYKVIAEDALANQSVASAQAAATVGADSSLPKVALTAPPSGSSQSGTITFSANASGSTPDHTISYGFDATGFRRSRTLDGATTSYLLNGQVETNSNGTITLYSIPGPTGDLIHYDGPPTSGTPTYLYFNGHGDLATQLVGSQTSPTTANTFRYDPFGDLLTAATATEATERYTGRWDKKLDPISDLIEMGARPYDPTLGRFYAVDPVDGGSLNNYDYAGQNPINDFDLDGTYHGDKGGVASLRELCGDFAAWHVKAVYGAGNRKLCNFGAGTHISIPASVRRAIHKAEPYIKGCITGGLTGAAYGAFAGAGAGAAAGAAVGCATEVGAQITESKVPGNEGKGVAFAIRLGGGLYGSKLAAEEAYIVFFKR